MKKIVSTILFATLLFCQSSLFAIGDEQNINEKNIMKKLDFNKNSQSAEIEEYRPTEVGYFYFYEEKNSYETKGEAFRVSGTLKAGRRGGTISVSYRRSRGAVWNISLESSAKEAVKVGASFTYNDSQDVEVGYSLNLAPYERAYIVATPVYKISNGVLKVYHGQRFLYSKNATVKSPQYFEYSLRH